MLLGNIIKASSSKLQILQEYRLLISPLPPPIEEEKKEAEDDTKAGKGTKSTKAQVKKFDNR